ncbi:unnamed protein product [Sphagnum jensenii]|uniref:Uncharacterized protein n=1 Tax=Sphagnum jensenii TaxID=128206 RepID=A0ABP0VIT9_9BRYO
MQGWSLARLHKEFLNMKQDYELQITKLKNSTANPFCVGFIYVQLPKEKSPTEIWPWMTWNDVSSTYAGVFFRVTGEEAAPFGQVQEDNAPRLGEVNTVWTYEAAWNKVSKHRAKLDSNTTIPKIGLSEWIRSGDSTGISRYMSFKLSDGEVRPRNMAIRIWKRTG